jgi:Mg-chelatase subunit ChlD
MSDIPLPRRPGGRMSSRPLHFIWLVDGSGSMRTQGKIQALNRAINEAIPHMQRVARENPQAAIFVNAI